MSMLDFFVKKEKKKCPADTDTLDDTQKAMQKFKKSSSFEDAFINAYISCSKNSYFQYGESYFAVIESRKSWNTST